VPCVSRALYILLVQTLFTPELAPLALFIALLFLVRLQVGLLNHKYFVLFCFYHALACVVATGWAYAWVHRCATAGATS
jgi:hypothetical protein